MIGAKRRSAKRGRSVLSATASESHQIIGLLEVLESGCSSSEFVRSSLGVAAHARARNSLALAAPASAALALTRTTPPVRAPVLSFAAVANAHATASPMFDACNSLVCFRKGPTGRLGTKGKFSACWPCTEASCVVRVRGRAWACDCR